ncbi:MAG: DUF2231 domain-containing protein [Chloroflexi bacterium]|nr:DUF2231 domain-containing protein [Chloroflexota bacterium]
MDENDLAPDTTTDSRAPTNRQPTSDLPFGDHPWSGRAGGSRSDAEPVQSVAAINGHPLHPSVVPLPIGAFVGAFVSDLAYARTHDPFWARSARLLTDAGIVTGLLAGSLGAMDFTGREQIRGHAAAWLHGGGNLAVIGLAVLSRSLRQRDERAAVMGGGLAISAMSAAILGMTGWLGGELAFRQRIGVTR